MAALDPKHDSERAPPSQLRHVLSFARIPSAPSEPCLRRPIAGPSLPPLLAAAPHAHVITLRHLHQTPSTTGLVPHSAIRPFAFSSASLTPPTGIPFLLFSVKSKFRGLAPTPPRSTAHFLRFNSTFPRFCPLLALFHFPTTAEGRFRTLRVSFGIRRQPFLSTVKGESFAPSLDCFKLPKGPGFSRRQPCPLHVQYLCVLSSQADCGRFP